MNTHICAHTDTYAHTCKDESLSGKKGENKWMNGAKCSVLLWDILAWYFCTTSSQNRLFKLADQTSVCVRAVSCVCACLDVQQWLSCVCVCSDLSALEKAAVQMRSYINSLWGAWAERNCACSSSLLSLRHQAEQWQRALAQIFIDNIITIEQPSYL